MTNKQPRPHQLLLRLSDKEYDAVLDYQHKKKIRTTQAAIRSMIMESSPGWLAEQKFQGAIKKD